MRKNMNRKVNIFKENINISKIICNHLVGQEHTQNHRILVGVIIMIFGVGLSMGAKIFDSSIIHFMGDGIGYLFHGLGGYPIIEAAVNQGQQPTNNKNG